MANCGPKAGDLEFPKPSSPMFLWFCARCAQGMCLLSPPITVTLSTRLAAARIIIEEPRNDLSLRRSEIALALSSPNIPEMLEIGSRLPGLRMLSLELLPILVLFILRICWLCCRLLPRL